MSSIFRHITRLQAGNLIQHTYSDVTNTIVDDLFSADTYWVAPVGGVNLTTLGAG